MREKRMQAIETVVISACRFPNGYNPAGLDTNAQVYGETIPSSNAHVNLKLSS
jgi:hypothetical protein